MSGNKTGILITGGLGNLGSWVTDHFSSSGRYDVTVLTKNDRNLNITHPFKKVFCDITDEKALRECFKTIDPDFVVHLASLNDTFLDDYANQSLLVNSLGTRNLLEACTGKKIRKFIYMSTFHVYGRDGGEISEQDVAAPVNDYAITHYFAEEYIRMFSKKQGLRYIIFRLSNSYGCPKDKQSGKWYLLFNDLCRQAVQQKKIEIRTNGTALRDFVYMNDVCEAIEAVVGNNELVNQIYNLGSGQSLSLSGMAAHIVAAYREMYGEEIETIKNKRDNTIYPSMLKFNIAKLIKDINFKPSFYYREEAKRIFEFVSVK